MFDFWKFYRGAINRMDYFDDYWEQFPKGHLFQFKDQTLSLLKECIKNQDAKGLNVIISIIWRDGADKDFTFFLLKLLDEKWHTLEEDIIGVLETIKDPKSIDKLFEVALDIPDYDEMRAIAKKCIWALAAINTPEAVEKIKALEKVEDPIISENATFQLDQILKKS